VRRECSYSSSAGRSNRQYSTGDYLEKDRDMEKRAKKGVTGATLLMEGVIAFAL